MPLETTPESPVPVRTVLRMVGDWIGRLGRIWVEGQIAELTRRGGTAFLTLRDPVAAVSVRVVCPRAVLDASGPAPAEGARVVVWARPDFSTARGSFSLAALEIRAVGIGELLARLERLREALAAEGLFAPERKRRLPFLPGTVGLICGRDSAAERDVQRNASRRWPAVRFRVEECAVQGTYAVAEVTAALQRLDADPAVAVIVIARGGGSLEDLLPFSDESLVRAVAAAGTPVVSAIGHEQDVPLLDLVADVRASTPTDAARRVVPDVGEQLAMIRDLRGRLRRSLTGRLDREAAWLTGMRSRPALASPLREIDRRQEQVTALAERARRCLRSLLDRAADDVSHTRGRLLALSPAATMRRGYAIVLRDPATVVRSAAEVAAGEELTIRFTEDQLSVTARDRRQTGRDQAS
ncbi:MAG: exodeoxyribonuclease VII large subunit [Nocardiopsaceae bacterium]|jgi:exodeoxyribonuclease VII large subunit|nr:exodeoxyribonuclease VII large subunit [Nocardiopsaceae bacterium]